MTYADCETTATAWDPLDTEVVADQVGAVGM